MGTRLIEFLDWFSVGFHRAFLEGERWKLYLKGMGVTLQLTIAALVIGIVLGLWGGYGISSLMGMEGYVAPSTVVYIALFSIAIGIFFGIYPARKAARLSPIEALRTE